MLVFHCVGIVLPVATSFAKVSIVSRVRFPDAVNKCHRRAFNDEPIYSMAAFNMEGFQMKKFIALLAASFFATGVLAQTAAQTIKSDVRAAKAEIKADAKAVKAEVKSVARKVKKSAKKAKAAVKAEAKAVKADAKAAKADAKADINAN